VTLKILGIMGSPRIKSNTDLLLDEALKGAQSQQAEVEKIIVDKLKITACREYYGCLRDGNCVIRADMDDVYAKLIAADGIIVGSPIFFYTVSAQLLTLISRCQALWAKKYVLKKVTDSGKKGVFIGVGATSGKKLFDGSILTMKYFFEAINAEYADNLLVRGVDRRAEIKERPGALQDALELGKRLANSLV